MWRCPLLACRLLKCLQDTLAGDAQSPGTARPRLAVGETVILLHPPLPLVGVSIWMERGCQSNDSLADG